MRPAAWLLGVGVALAPSLASACPGCQNPNLPVVPSGGAHLGDGAVQWGALLSLAPIWVRHEDGCADLTNCDQVPVQPTYVHDQFLMPMELRGTLDWALTEHLGLTAQLPVRMVLTTIGYETPEGAHYDPPNEGTHHRNEALVGLGDPLLGVRLGGVLAEAWWVVAQLGVSVPLGRTEANPFAAGDRGDTHQHIQFGSGTFDPLVSLAVARTLDRF